MKTKGSDSPALGVTSQRTNQSFNLTLSTCAANVIFLHTEWLLIHVAVIVQTWIMKDTFQGILVPIKLLNFQQSWCVQGQFV